MNEKFLRDIGLTDDGVIEKIITRHQDGFQDLAALEQEVTDLRAAAVNREKTEAIMRHLEFAKADPRFIKLLAKEFDLDEIEVTDGKILNWEELLAPVKAAFPDQFGKTSEKGAEARRPPAMSRDIKNPWAKGHSNLEEQTRIYRESPARAQALAKAAGVRM